VDGLFLEADDRGGADASQHLHVEDLVNPGLELQERNGLAGLGIHDPDTAFQLLAAFSEGDATEGGGFADL
jgi:hypothetical protein